MRVVIASRSLGLGGVRMTSMELGWALAKRGCDVAIVGPDAEPRGDREAELCEGLELYPDAKDDARETGRRIRDLNPDMVRLMTGAFPPDTRLALPLTTGGVRVVESLHLFKFGARVGPLRRLMYTARPASRYRLLVPTITMYEWTLERLPSHKRVLRLVRQGIRLPDLNPQDVQRTGSEPLRIVTVCRLVERHKDVSTLLRAIAIARHEVSIELKIVGDGRDRDALESLARDLGVSDVVTFAGWLNNPLREVASGHVFALSTKLEASPRVILEAGSLGVTSVASKVIGCWDLVEHEKTGLLCAPGDPHSMAEAFVLLANDEARRRELGAAAREHAKRLNVDAWAEGTLEVAREIGITEG
ncbi:MAG: glycosyltransferase family 4 protein [Planctomycetota bacterium]